MYKKRNKFRFDFFIVVQIRSFNADPGPAYQTNEDPDSHPAFQTNTNPDLGMKLTKIFTTIIKRCRYRYFYSIYVSPFEPLIKGRLSLTGIIPTEKSVYI
jgi:hypothetical protein